MLFVVCGSVLVVRCVWLVVVRWLMGVECCLPVFVLFVVCCWLLLGRCLMVVVCCVLFYCLLFVVAGCLSCVACRVSFEVCCLLFVCVTCCCLNA